MVLHLISEIHFFLIIDVSFLEEESIFLYTCLNFSCNLKDAFEARRHMKEKLGHEINTFLSNL